MELGRTSIHWLVTGAVATGVLVGIFVGVFVGVLVGAFVLVLITTNDNEFDRPLIPVALLLL